MWSANRAKAMSRSSSDNERRQLLLTPRQMIRPARIDGPAACDFSAQLVIAHLLHQDAQAVQPGGVARHV
jgi:hypothetical protein